MKKAVVLVLKILVYPWGIWSLCGYLPKHVRVLFLQWRRTGRWARRAIHLLLFAVVGLPAIVFITGEILIYLNESIVGEQSKYRIEPVDINWSDDTSMDVPGAHVPVSLSPVDKKDRESYHRYLTELYSPVIIQKIGHHPAWDVPVFFDFDGNEDPRDNLAKELRYTVFNSGIYGEVVSETEDSYYLVYSLYHLRDYDHPIRELLSSWSYHDSDNEGLLIRVDKKNMRVQQAEGWFHNRFFLANATGQSEGSEPIQGKLYCENDTHIVVYAQSLGHGVRCAQISDLEDLDQNVKILRFQGNGPAVPVLPNRDIQINATYMISNFDRWYYYARGPLGTEGNKGMFESSIPLGFTKEGKPLVIGRFIAGLDRDKGFWSRPKPPWSWDDPWDDVPIFIWHFYPSYAISSHFGIRLSHRYLFNRPVSKTFGMDPAALLPLLSPEKSREGGNKWARDLELEDSPDHKAYARAASIYIKRYINHLFNKLG